MKTISNSLSSERGNLLIELVMTLPIFMVIAFSGLEFASAIRNKQMAQVLSRAASRSALICTGYAERRTGNDLAKGCLQLVLDKMQAQVQAIAPGSQLNLTLLSEDLSLAAPRTIYEEATVGGGIRKLRPDQESPENLLVAGNQTHEMLDNHGVAIICEVTLNRQNISNFFGINTLYDATVL